MNVLLLVRHCESSGQEREASLSERGHAQARALARWLAAREPAPVRIVSSPFRRALETIEPFARASGLEIERDERLGERRLSGAPLPDWREHVRRGFEELDYAAPGGESSREGRDRGWAAIEAAASRGPAVLVSHGNLLSLVLQALDPDFGYPEWMAMGNPDVFRLTRARRDAAWTFARAFARADEGGA